MKLLNEQDAIKQAAEGGWEDHYDAKGCEIYPIDHAASDPAFWKALGNARGWSVETFCPFHHGGGDTEACEGHINESELHAHEWLHTRLSNGDMQKFWHSLP